MSRPQFAIALMCGLAACEETAAPPSHPHVVDDSWGPGAHMPPRPNRQTQAPLEHYAHENDIEYQNGLAELMRAAPIFGARMVTLLFRFGYQTGIAEAVSYQVNVNGRFHQIGCGSGFLALKDYFRMPTPEEIERMKAFCANTQPDAKYEGALYARGRLGVAQIMAETATASTSPEEIDVKVNIFGIAYHLGFVHQWESIDQETNARAVVRVACKRNVDAQQGTLTPSQFATATSKCDDAAVDMKHVAHGLQCWFVGSSGSQRTTYECGSSAP